MSDDINDGLTPEERAALEINDDEAPSEPKAVAAAELAAEDKPATKAEDKPDETKPAPGTDADAGGDDATAAGKPAAEPTAAAPEPEAAPSQAAQPAPILVAEAPSDADAKLADIATKKDDLAQKFDDGDITAKEYHSQLDALNKQERGIEMAQHKAQMANEMAEQQRLNAWYTQAQAFAIERGYTDQRRMNLIDAEVRAVATADPTLTGMQVLQKAHQNLIDAGLAPNVAAKPAAPTAAPAAQAKSKPVELPPSIHKLPAADVDDTGAGEFAELDRLASTDPLKYEQTLAKMSEAQRDRYLAA